MTEPAPDHPMSPPPSLRYRVTVAVAIAVAAAALVAGIRATETGDEGAVIINGRPDVVEHVVPAEGAEVLHQVRIGIDLAPGYEGGLILNGTAIPTDQLDIVSQQNQVSFTPGPDRVFDELPTGPNCVTAIVWKSSEGQGKGSDLSFQWCFDVT